MEDVTDDEFIECTPELQRKCTQKEFEEFMKIPSDDHEIDIEKVFPRSCFNTIE